MTRPMLALITVLGLTGAGLTAAPTAAAKAPSLFAPGSTFVYQVDDSYLFILRLTAWSAKGYEFTWLMTGDSGKRGKITVAADAKKKAVKLFNYFGQGDTKLTEETSVFVSDAVFKAMKAKTPIALGLGKDSATFADADDAGFKPISVDARFGDVGAVSVFVVEDKAKGYRMTVLDNEKFPLIVSMNIGFSVRLLAVL
jgi:hypothetical protein